MKRTYITIITIILVAIGITSFTCYAQDKLAQTGYQFLSVVPDAKASAVGEAMTAIEGKSTSLFFNPAGMANMEEKTVNLSFSINSWIADIKHSAFSICTSPYGGRYGVLGLALQYVDYGDVQGTMVYQNSQGYIDTEVMHPSALSLGIGYAKMLSDKFSVGGQVKFVYQSLGKSVVTTIDEDSYYTKRNVTHGFAVDFGTLYKTGYKSVAFGMSVRNFSQEFKYEEEGFQLPLLFTIGVSMDLMDFEVIEFSGAEQALILSVDATHPRSHNEQIKIGLDYQLLNVLSLRGGYVSGNDEDGFSFGLGISYLNAAFDYAYTPFGVFNHVQRITARLSF